MEGTLKANVSCIIFAHEFETMDFNVFLERWCNCGCGYYKYLALINMVNR